MPGSIDSPLPPDVGAAVDAALSDLEERIPGVSTDPKVRGEVQAAVKAALASLDRVVPQATEAATRRTLEASEPIALAGMAATKEASAPATRRALGASEPTTLAGVA